MGTRTKRPESGRPLIEFARLPSCRSPVVGVRLLAATSLWTVLGCGACGRQVPPPAPSTNNAQTRSDDLTTEPTEYRHAPDLDTRADATRSVIPLRLPTRGRVVGTNLAGVSYWSRSYPFVDAFRVAERWISGNADVWDDGRAIATDDHGWVRSLARGQIARVFLIGGDVPHPTGEFTVLYEGRGRLEYRGGVGEVHRSAGRDIVRLERHDGLWLEIHETDPTDPIRSIRVIFPGGSCSEDASRSCTTDAQCESECLSFESTHTERIFHPDFLADVAPFGVLRFMDWQLTNRERAVDDAEEPPPVRTVSDLPTRRSAFWRPMPVDVMVELANLLDADPWFCMPTEADDSVVRHLAERVAAGLEPDRRVFVEYSNETWNDIFDQHQIVNARGCRRASSQPERECGTGGGTLCAYTSWNQTQERCVRYGRIELAHRSVEVGRIWRNVFDDDTRVRRVLGTQVGGHAWWIPELLELRIDGRAAHESLDVVAVAPYFGGGGQTAADVYRQVRIAGHDAPVDRALFGTGRDDGGPYRWVRDDVAALRSQISDGIEYLAYEGGQHYFSHDEAEMNAILAANRNPRMEALYGRYLTMWRVLTNDALFVHFTSPQGSGRFGAWGSKEYQAQPVSEAPKHRALLRYVDGG